MTQTSTIQVSIKCHVTRKARVAAWFAGVWFKLTGREQDVDRMSTWIAEHLCEYSSYTEKGAK